VNKFPDCSPDESGNFDCEFITFVGTDITGIKFLDLEQYINPKLFNRFSKEEQNLIKSRIIDIYHDDSQ
jgi:hypothetical protein